MVSSWTKPDILWPSNRVKVEGGLIHYFFYVGEGLIYGIRRVELLIGRR